MSSSIHVAFYIRGHEFFIIGYLDLVSLPFYYLITLAYVMSHILRLPWGHGIRCRFRQLLLRQAFEIWLIFRYHHASSSGKCLCDVWTRFSCGYGWSRLHIWWWMIQCCLIFRSTIHLMPYGSIFPFRLIFVDLHEVTWSSLLTRCMSSW